MCYKSRIIAFGQFFPSILKSKAHIQTHTYTHTHTETYTWIRDILLAMCVCLLSCFSCVWLFTTPQTLACQAPLCIVFYRQEYWSGLPCLPPADLPSPGIEPASLNLLHCQGGSLPLVPPGKPLVESACESESRSVTSDSLGPHGLYSPWNPPGQNTGVGSFSLFQGIFPTQESNPGLTHWRQSSHQLSHKGKTRSTCSLIQLSYITYLRCYCELNRILIITFRCSGSTTDFLSPGHWHVSLAKETYQRKNKPSSVQFSRSVLSDSLRPHKLQHARPPCPSATPRVHSNSCPSSWWCHITNPSSVVPFSSYPQSFKHQGLFNESAILIRWPKYWSFSFSVSSSNEYAGLISFRMDWLDLPTIQGTLKSLLQHHSLKA